ncbi:MAG: hypothetical protein ABI839_08120 [Verrucomicrobiota bacterium]
MMNPNGDEFNEVPAGGAADIGGEAPFSQRGMAEMAGNTWEQTKERAGVAAERTQVFLRENPIPTLIGALGVGIAIGLAIRYASNATERPEEKLKNDFVQTASSFLSLPFLWPLLKSAREKAEDSSEVVMDNVKEGVNRLKKVKVSKYTKPMKKRWNAWTR